MAQQEKNTGNEDISENEDQENVWERVCMD